MDLLKALGDKLDEGIEHKENTSNPKTRRLIGKAR